MSRKGTSIHMQRSLYVVAKIRQENALSSEEFASKVRLEYAKRHMLAHAPAAETVRAYFNGRRPIPYELPIPGGLSYLVAIERAFPGAQHYFFHPLFNLLGGPIRTSADRQVKQLQIPKETIDGYREQDALQMAEDCERHNQRLLVKAKDKRASVEGPVGLHWIHSTMYAIDMPVRDVLFTQKGLGNPRRQYRSVAHEIADLVQLGGVDALAGAVGLFLEGREADDLTKMVSAKAGAEQILEGLSNDLAVRKIYPALSSFVRFRTEDTMIFGVNQIDAYTAQYPQTWGVALGAFPPSSKPNL